MAFGAVDNKKLALSQPLNLERCTIRRFVDTDVAPVAELLGNDKATRYLPFPQALRSAKGAEMLIQSTIGSYDTDKPSLAYAVVESGTNTFIGFCGMNPLPDAEIELMYAVSPARWGEGFGGNIALALCQHVLATIPELTCVAFVHPENTPSISILEKLGFQALGLTRHDMFDVPVLKFEKLRSIDGIAGPST